MSYFVLAHPEARRRAALEIQTAPDGYVVKISEPTRNLEQNAALWALLADVSRQVEWYGRKLSPEDWKAVFTAALKKSDVVPGIDGGFVVLGQSTSRMTKQEMSNLLELISAFGIERSVVFRQEDCHVEFK